MNNNYLRVGIYLRLSNEDKDKINKNEISESIKNQRNMLIQYISNHPELKLVNEYSDEDLSGAGTYRPEFERLIKDCENRKLDVVLCKSQSRFSRDMEIVEKYINNKFKEWNIRFIGLADNADTLVLGNKKARQINGLVNEWYIEDVSNNIRSAFKSKMMQGELISPFSPFGYEISKTNNNKLVIDPVASIIVKNIYNLYLTGLGFTGIANYLNNKNIPSPSLYKYQNGVKLNIVSKKNRDEIKWNAAAIKRILTNEVYLGHLIQGKRTTISYKNHKIIKKDKKAWIRKENTHEPIIDDETFNKVNILIKERTKPIKKTNSSHIFSGKVFCDECKCIMRKKNSSKHEYLVCYNNQCLNKISIRYDKLSDIILKNINDKIKKYYDLDELKYLQLKKNNKMLKSKIKYLTKKQSDIANKIKKIKDYIKCLYEDKINSIISKDEFEYIITNYNKDKSSYEKQIKYINDEINYYQRKSNDNAMLTGYKRFDKLNNIIMQEFIDKIYIGKPNKKTNIRNIIIKWQF